MGGRSQALDIVRVCKPMVSLPSHPLPLTQTNRYSMSKEAGDTGKSEDTKESHSEEQSIEARGKDKGEKSITGQEVIVRRQ